MTPELALQLAKLHDLAEEGVRILGNMDPTPHRAAAADNLRRAMAHFRAALESPDEESEESAATSTEQREPPEA